MYFLQLLLNMTVTEMYKNFVEQLSGVYDEREASNIADWVFESIAGISRAARVTGKQKQLSNSTIEQLNNSLNQLLTYRPVQYVLGEVWFYKMKLKVNAHVLIPRPETEELVECVVEGLKIKNKPSRMTRPDGVLEISLPEQPGWTRNKEVGKLLKESFSTEHPINVLDIGTGSGCIAIALKKQLPLVNVTAIDVSEGALAVAKENAGEQNVEINFQQVDFLDNALWKQLPSFDIIISNPPYIPSAEKKMLAKNVTDHEPHLALFVDDHDPFIFYKKIAEFGSCNLSKEGKIFVEVHEQYANDVRQIFEQKNFTTEIKKDMYGRERMVMAERQ